MKGKIIMGKKLFLFGISMLLLLFISACGSSGGSGSSSGGGNDSASGTYSISGVVTEGNAIVNTDLSGIAAAGDGLPGVTMTLGGDASDTKITGPGGTYTFTGLGNGTYTVTPSMTGRNFNDVSTVIPINGVAALVNFEATADGLGGYGGISGSVYYVESTTTTSVANKKVNQPTTANPVPSGMAGVTITLYAGAAGASSALNGAGSLGTTLTDGAGNYSFTGLPVGYYYVTASKPGYDPIDPSETLYVNNDIQHADFDAYTPEFLQSDLEGTWAFNILKAGGGYGGSAEDGWTRGTAVINAAGVVTMTCSNSDSSVCTLGTMTWTIGANGVITLVGDSEAHLTMTANKNFIAGTMTGSGSDSQLLILQKMVTGTAYGNADLWKKNFVYHGMSVGATNGWAHGSGSTDAAGTVTMGTPTTSSDEVATLPSGLSMSVSSVGYVTISGYPTFQGFLSDDRKTIVGTLTTGTSYQLIIIQVIGQKFLPSAPPLEEASSILGFLNIKPLCLPEPMPWGYYKGHMLAAFDGSDAASVINVSAIYDFWAHYSTILDGLGTVYSKQWVTSSGLTIPDSSTSVGYISEYGTITITSDPTSNGQMSHDGLFIVNTQTSDGFSMLSVGMRGVYDTTEPD
jgi:hypothetical protein